MLKRYYFVPFICFALAFLIYMTTSTRLLVAGLCCELRDAQIEVQAEIITKELDEPWGFDFLPNGSVLVTERTGQLRLVQNGIVSEPIEGVPVSKDIGQGGLLDVIVDNKFEQTGWVYLTFAHEVDGAYSTAVARAKLNGDRASLDNLEVIFSANKKSSGGRHFGSRIRIGTDNTLYVTLGDRGEQKRAQDPFDHAGSVIRIKTDGSIPQDNPFANGEDALPEIYSIGHRNAQGATFHPQTGEYWTLSHGPSGGDELNKPKAGKNYGWPLISYGSQYSGGGFEKGAEAQGLEQPIYYWDPSIAPSGLEFYVADNALIKQWEGSLFLGALRGQHLTRLVLDGDKVIAEERYFENEFGRIRDVKTGPDGALWMITDDSEGNLIRITPK